MRVEHWQVAYFFKYWHVDFNCGYQIQWFWSGLGDVYFYMLQVWGPLEEDGQIQRMLRSWATLRCPQEVDRGKRRSIWGAWALPSPDWEKNKADGGSCLEEFHQLKASSGTGGSELATETFRESNIKEEDRGRRNKQPPQDDFCSFNESFGVSRQENSDSFFQQLMLFLSLETKGSRKAP